MQDTVKLRSMWLPAPVGVAVEKRLKRLQMVDIETDTLEWGLTRGELLGSFDHRISVKTAWSAEPAGDICQVIIEGSVHKALLGHNVFGGPCEPVASCRWLVAEIGRRLDVRLPDGLDWTPLRIDESECYDVGSFKGVEEYMRGLNNAAYPRRRVFRYGAETIFAPGTTTTVKAYHKLPELMKHDASRLKAALGDAELCRVKHIAERILRVEVEVKAKALRGMFGNGVTVRDLVQSKLSEIHDLEWMKLIDEGRGDMEIVRTHKEVSRRLEHQYGHALGNILFGTWLQLSALGEVEVKQRMARPTWYRQKKQLVEAGVSWQASDVRIVELHSSIPSGFSPVRVDVRRLQRVDASVTRKLVGYGLAA